MMISDGLRSFHVIMSTVNVVFASRMTSVLESVLAGPPSERWLTAHHDPLAGIYTFSSCLALSGRFILYLLSHVSG
jgi:hypothetical protein